MLVLSRPKSIDLCKFQQIQIPQFASTVFDMIRWISAIIVLIGHLRNELFLPYRDIVSPDIIDKIFYLATSAGHQAVIIFFVLSGMFIGSSVINAFQSNQWSWCKYLVQRITRLYIVLIPAIIITVLVNHFLHIKDEGTTWITILGNVVMLQETWVPVLSSNSPLWSLAYEFWYYILFPILILSLYRSHITSKLLYLVCCALLLIFIGHKISIYFITWCFGVLAVVLPRINLRNLMSHRLFPAIVLSSFFISVFVIRCGFEFFELTKNAGIVKYSLDFLLAVICSIAFYLLLCFATYSQFSFPFEKIHKYLANFSFTTYLVHMPLLTIMLSFFARIRFHRLSVNALNILLLLASTGLLLFATYLISLVTERHTKRLRQWFLQKLKT